MFAGAPRAGVTLLATLLLGLRAHHRGELQRTRLLRLGALLVVALPWEALLAQTLDIPLQHISAAISAWGVRLTGLPVTLSAPDGQPHLLTAHADVHITNLCAGLETFVGLTGLGLVLAEVFMPDDPRAWRLVLLTPLFGFAGNVVRITLSTHAANLWGNDARLWPLAHDSIGYAAFALTYAALFALIRYQCRSRQA